MKYLFNCIIVVFCLLLFSNCEETPGPVDPVLPSLSIEDITITETDEDFNANVKITLTGTNNANVVVSYKTEAATATADEDYKTIEAGEVILNPGILEKTIQVKIKGDEITEQSENFKITITNASNTTIEKSTATITITDDDEVVITSGELQIPETGYTTPDSYPGMTLVWSDEFDGPEIDMNNWTFEVGGNGWGNNELQYYTDGDNAHIEDGNLIITAKREFIAGREYSSTRMITENKQEFQYGRIDIRAALPTGKGCWPALWMLGTDFRSDPVSGDPGVGWPRCGEIDIMELVSQEPNKVHGTVHWYEQGVNSGNHASHGSNRNVGNDSSFDGEYHVFSLIWQEDFIQILLDDEDYMTFGNNPNFAGQWNFNQPFFFIFNIAVGGNWPENPDTNSPFPQYMIVDYVRVFQ